MTVSLPNPDTLAIDLRGEIVASNFDEFASEMGAWLRTIHVELETDEDFAAAEDDVKAIKAAETALTKAKAAAIERMEGVYALLSGIDELNELGRAARLDLSRQIKDRKQEVRVEILDAAVKSVDSFLWKRISPRIAEAMKGKKTVDTLRAAAEGEVECINEQIKLNRETIAEFEDLHGRTLTVDADALELMDPEPLRLELIRRKDRQDSEIERKKLADQLAEEKAKANQPPDPEPAPRQSKPLAEVQSYDPIDTPEQELARFLAVIKAAFAEVKTARQALKHNAVIAAADEFAAILAPAWADLKGGLE